MDAFWKSALETAAKARDVAEMVSKRSKVRYPRDMYAHIAIWYWTSTGIMACFCSGIRGINSRRSLKTIQGYEFAAETGRFSEKGEPGELVCCLLLTQHLIDLSFGCRRTSCEKWRTMESQKNILSP